MKNKTYVFFWITAVIVMLFDAFLHFQMPGIIDMHFQSGNYAWLNHFANVTSNQSLDYYQGRIVDQLTGPLMNILYHLIFVIFCLLQKESFFNRRNFFFCIFLFLIISKFEILFYPPYGDAIGGPFAEAMWLANNHFNYPELMNSLSYDQGGPRVYMFSLYPSYLAVLMTFIRSVKAFLIINHLLTFCMASAVIVWSKEILKSLMNERLAVLGSLIILALPIFQSQTEAINMEMPSLFISMLAIYYLNQKKIKYAALWSICAAFVKGHAVMICGAVFLISLMIFIFDDNRKGKYAVLVWGGIALLGAVLKVSTKFLLHDQHASAGMMSFLAGLPSLRIMYLPVIYLFSLVLFIVFILIQNKGISKIISFTYKNHYTQLVILTAALMWFVLFLNFYAVSPRYKLELAPFLVMCLLASVLNFNILRRISIPLLICGVLLTSLGSYGFYHHPLGANYHVLSERSLEYRNNVKLDQHLASYIEEHYSQMKIGAPHIMAQMLYFPQLGYVSKSLNVFAYGMPVKYGGMNNFNGLNKSDITKTIWVGVAAQVEKNSRFPYPVHPQDKMVKTFEWGANRTFLFMGGFAVEQRRQILDYMKKRQGL